MTLATQDAQTPMPAIRLLTLTLTLTLSLLNGCTVTADTPTPDRANGLSYPALGDSYTIGRAVPVTGEVGSE